MTEREKLKESEKYKEADKIFFRTEANKVIEMTRKIDDNMIKREKLKELKKAEKSMDRRNKKKLKDNWSENRKCKECGNPISNDWIWNICGECKHRKIKPFKPKYSD